MTATSQAIAHTLLHLLTKSAPLDEVAPQIMQLGCEALDASAALYCLVEEPRVCLPFQVASDVLLETESVSSIWEQLWLTTAASNSLTRYLYSELPEAFSGYQSWLVLPLYGKGRRIGGVAWLFESLPMNIDANADPLQAVIDALGIISNTAMMRARHDGIIRNQNEFVRIVSHDLRSPLTSIQGFASMLESNSVGELNERQLYFVQKILAGVTQMTSLVDNIQDAGRYDPDTGFYQMERAPTDLGDIARRVIKNALIPAEKQDLQVHLDVADDLPIVNVDAQMLERGIINLVDNAIKYTPNGGRVEVRVSHRNGELIIAVKDDGLGISPEHVRQLFQRHFRIRRPEHKKVKGSGLGLFIVRSVARQHGGDAYVESIEGQGSTFSIRIPLAGLNLIGGNLD